MPLDKTLRAKAEALIADGTAGAAENKADFGDVESQKFEIMLHELQVRQVELEMQNDELKKSQSDLSIAKANYFDIYNLAPVGYLILNSKGMIINANIKATNMLGVRYDKLLKVPFSRYIAKDFQDDYYICLRQLKSSKEQQDLEIQLKDFTGTALWLHLTISVVEDESGECVYRVVMADISQRKLLEVRLIDQENLYRSIFSAESDALFLLDQETGTILEANTAASKNYGYTHEELLKLKNSDVSAEPDETVKMTKKFVESVPIRYHKRKDNSVFPVEITASIFTLKGRKVILAAIRDISVRKHLEEELVKTEEGFKLMFENNNSVMLMIQIDTGKIIGANEAAVKFYGYTAFELEDISITDINILPELQVKKEMAKAFKQECHTFYFNHKLKNGEIIPVEVHSTPFHYKETTILLSTVYDIRERKAKDEEVTFLSYHDQLTGLYNRRFYQEELRRLDTVRNFPLTIAMGDVNGLKLINDSFGHLAGDELLKKTAEIIKKGCRTDDIIARIGGDEFVIILPNTDTVETERVIERIQNLAKEENIMSLEVSISFGHATKTRAKQDVNDVFKDAEDFMYRHKLYESSSMRSKMIDLIMSTLHEENPREMEHSEKVSEIAGAIAVKLGLNADDINQIRIAGLMHDIGKIGVDDTLLNSRKKFTRDEMKEIQRHSEIGYRILSGTNEFSEIANCVLEHHERWDGQGYPKGIRGDEILLQARIICLADAYDAMTRERNYKEVLSKQEAGIEIEKCSGSQFDPALVKVFIEEVLDSL